jgi:demethylmenaquinone methyltransferase/2-methoxy-6-polyprenyl-1,4-benzoquinol methylase
MSNAVLQEQINYYRARAGEYDEWFYRQGRFNHGEVANRQWFDEVEVVRQALRSLKPTGEILELASGTGIWTEELVKYSTRVTCIDASPEMIAIHQVKLQNPEIIYQQADLFTWQPDQTYDFVFFGFWLSHVPSDKLALFLKTVRSALKPDGCVFMVDSRKIPTSTAHNQVLPEEGELMKRTLNDGQNFTIVKVFYTPPQLETAFAEAGITARAHFTETFFIYASGEAMKASGVGPPTPA